VNSGKMLETLLYNTVHELLHATEEFLSVIFAADQQMPDCLFVIICVHQTFPWGKHSYW
jgi:hypothetical protein